MDSEASLSDTFNKDKHDPASTLQSNPAVFDKIDATGNTPLMQAVLSKNLQSATLLIKCGAAVDARGNRNQTALMLAVQEDNLEIIKFLLDEGASVHAKDLDGRSAVMHCRSADSALLLLGSGAVLHEKDNHGNTVIVRILLNDYQEAIFPLIEEGGADVNESGIGGMTPLMAAAYQNYTDTARFLIGRGADIDKENADGETALMIAAKYDHAVMAQILMKAGASLDKRNKHNNSALDLAPEGTATERMLLAALIEKATAARKVTDARLEFLRQRRPSFTLKKG